MQFQVIKPMTEGTLIKILFDLGLTSLTDKAHEAKFIQDLEANGTNIEEFMKKAEANNGTMSEYDRRSVL